MSINAVPVLKDELNRKTLEAIDWLFSEFRNGRTTAYQFKCGVDTLFAAVSGLVDDDLIALLSSADELLEEQDVANHKITRHFIGTERTITVERILHSEKYTLRNIKKDSETIQEFTFDTTKDANESMEATCKKLIRIGYREL